MTGGRSRWATGGRADMWRTCTWWPRCTPGGPGRTLSEASTGGKTSLNCLENLQKEYVGKHDKLVQNQTSHCAIKSTTPIRTVVTIHRRSPTCRWRGHLWPLRPPSIPHSTSVGTDPDRYPAHRHRQTRPPPTAGVTLPAGTGSHLHPVRHLLSDICGHLTPLLCPSHPLRPKISALREGPRPAPHPSRPPPSLFSCPAGSPSRHLAHLGLPCMASFSRRSPATLSATSAHRLPTLLPRPPWISPRPLLRRGLPCPPIASWGNPPPSLLHSSGTRPEVV